MRIGLLITGTVFVFFVLIVCLFFYLFPYYEIKDSVDVTSPDARYIASGFHIYGGATVHDSTIIQLRPNKFLDAKVPVLVVDMVQPDNPFSISWLNNHELLVTYTRGSVYIQKQNWKDVEIKYIEK